MSLHHLLARHRRRSFRLLVVATACCLCAGWQAPLAGQEKTEQTVDRAPNLAVLSDVQWKRIDASVDRALECLAKHQQSNGSFEAPIEGQPAVTALCVMAFLSRGHVPGVGPYGKHIERGIDYTLSTQKPAGTLTATMQNTRPEYNHAIAGLMLGEVYGMTSGERSERIGKAIPRAIKFSRSLQTMRKRNTRDLGGWRYIQPWGPNDSDMTATSWHLMFYRSAKNAEFEVPKEYIEEAMAYVRRCYDPREKAFVYALAQSDEHYASGGSVGGGVVAMAMGGEHNTDIAESCGKWILDNPFDQYNRRRQKDDRYHYSAYYCSQAMFQLGGRFWEEFYPPFQETLLENQRRDGSWEEEASNDGEVGNIYTTALVVLALTPPYQILPIYQR